MMMRVLSKLLLMDCGVYILNILLVNLMPNWGPPRQSIRMQQRHSSRCETSALV